MLDKQTTADTSSPPRRRRRSTPSVKQPEQRIKNPATAIFQNEAIERDLGMYPSTRPPEHESTTSSKIPKTPSPEEITKKNPPRRTTDHRSTQDDSTPADFPQLPHQHMEEPAPSPCGPRHPACFDHHLVPSEIHIDAPPIPHPTNDESPCSMSIDSSQSSKVTETSPMDTGTTEPPTFGTALMPNDYGHSHRPTSILSMSSAQPELLDATFPRLSAAPLFPNATATDIAEARRHNWLLGSDILGARDLAGLFELDGNTATGSTLVVPSPETAWPPAEHVLLDRLSTLLSSSPRPRTQSKFRFEFSTEAAQHNGNVLAEHNFDLASAVLEDPDSHLQFGAEFRDVPQLEPIFQGHPLWPRMKQVLQFGARFPLRPLDPETQRSDLEAAIEFGNHKSARENNSEILKSLANEVERGWQLPIPIYVAKKLPGAAIGPLGMANQLKLLADGSRIPAFRTTHNMSWDFTPDCSVNHRVLHDALTPCVYGFGLKRFIHQIILMRTFYGPGVPLLLGKIDLKSAFRRVQAHLDLAVQTITTTLGIPKDEIHEHLLPEDIALIALRLTFGGAGNPSIFGEVSEPITDLTNVLAECQSWPQEYPDLTPQHAHLLGEMKLVEPERPEDPPVPYALAKPMLVQPTLKERGSADCFIDDIFSLAPFLPKLGLTAHRLVHATMVAIDAIGRDPSSADVLARDFLLSVSKTTAEGTPTERLTILGWLLDTRRLLILLPHDKFIAWTADIDEILQDSRQRVPVKVLESLIGRCEHVVNVIPEAGHFLGLLRRALQRAKSKWRGLVRLTKDERDDLRLWKLFLKRAHEGVDMNNITVRLPTTCTLSDACTYGLGGYSARTGRAWRWHLPPHCVGFKSINLLEFLASSVSTFLSVIEGELSEGDCHLSVVDNTSSNGWTRRSNFAPDSNHEEHFHLARLTARMSLHHQYTHFSQWLMGRRNDVPDLLSRDTELSDADLTTYIKNTFPTQVPESFVILPLPNEITSLLSVIVEHNVPPKESSHPRTNVRTKPGDGGLTSLVDVVYEKTTSFEDLVNQHGIASSPVLPKPSARAPGESPPNQPSPMEQILSWVRERSTPPSRMWERPSPVRVSPTLDKSGSPVTLQSFYLGN